MADNHQAPDSESPLGQPADPLVTDLSGHFWAEVRCTAPDNWSFVIKDYQNNEMLRGSAPTPGFAEAVISAWDRVVVTGNVDPSRAWADDQE